MGVLRAIEIASMDLPIEEKIKLHLTTNFYQEISSEWVPYCALAVNLCGVGKSDAYVNLPDGATYEGGHSAPASVIVQNFHLNLFVDYGEEEVADEE